MKNNNININSKEDELKIPWEEMLNFSVRELKLAPSEFWQLSFNEFRIICGKNSQLQAISKSELEALINRMQTMQKT